MVLFFGILLPKWCDIVLFACLSKSPFVYILAVFWPACRRWPLRFTDKALAVLS